jgi:DNA-directed DNA polymerase III PolC
MHYPVVKTPEGQTQADYLRQKAYAGARIKYIKLTEEITARLDYELNIISDLGYEPIFLIVEEVIKHARELGIPTSSRGSAASSLVAHCLDITSPDPIALDLYFERFLNPARQKPPDIDTDIASHRRDEVIQYVFDKFGSNKVAMVSTINRYRPKSAIIDVGKAYGLSLETIRLLTRKLPSSFSYRRGNEEKDPFNSLMVEAKIPHIDEVIRDTRKLMDMPRHLSVHPGGIVISPFPITDLVPLVHSSSLELNHTQFDLESIEKLGLVKIDLLGIKGLTVIGEVANQIQTWRLSEFKNGLDVLDSIPEEDQATASTVTEGKTIGCFQIESPGMRGTLREIQAKSVEEIMAALALYRPGPLRGGLRDAFVRRFRGEEQITHIHPALKELLGSTYGVILYQEQVLRIAHEIGGLSIAQADILRRAMSHFDPGSMMETLKHRFIEGAMQNRQVPPDVAEHIWEMMAAFAGYGFPKAHAASYARLAWNSAWCKTHFPAEFMSAVLSYGGGYYSQRVYLMESRRLGLTIKAPHVNHSAERFRVKYPGGLPVIYMGLAQVRDLSYRTINAIIKHQPFSTIEDFIVQVDPQKKEAQNLVKCGALEGLVSIEEGLKFLEHKQVPGQYLLFSSPSSKEDWDLERKFQAQQEILGLSVELTPLERYADKIQATGALSTAQAHEFVGERISIAGMKQSLRRFKTKSNQTLCYLNLEDLEGALQILVTPHIYRKHYLELQEAGPFLIQGIMELDADRHRYYLNAEKIILLSAIS